MIVPSLQDDPTDEPEFPEVRAGKRGLRNDARGLLRDGHMRFKRPCQSISDRTGYVYERIGLRPLDVTIPIRPTKSNHEPIDWFDPEKRVEQ